MKVIILVSVALLIFELCRGNNFFIDYKKRLQNINDQAIWRDGQKVNQGLIYSFVIYKFILT